MLGTAVEGRSHEEVAASLGITSGSVRGLLYRARSTLRAAAAALIPPPMIEWAIRQQQAGRAGASGMVEAVAGGGSAGVAGAMLKGGAVVTLAGALAGTATVVVAHHFHIRTGPARAPVLQTAAPKRRIVAVIAVPAAADAPASAERTGSAAGARPEPVRLLVSGRHVGSSRPDGSIDGRRAVGRSDRSGADRAARSYPDSNQLPSGPGDGSRPADHQWSGSTGGGGDPSLGGSGWTGSGGGATASAFEGDRTARSQVAPTDASTGSPGAWSTATGSSQPTPSPSGTGSGVTGSEYEAANGGSRGSWP